MALLQYLVAAVKTFVAAAPGAIQGHLNTSELQRVTLTALLTGGVAAVGPALLSSAAAIVAPGDAALATGLATVVVEVFRRLGHGPTLSQVFAGQVVAPPPTATR